MKKAVHQLLSFLMVLVMLFDAAPIAALAEGDIAAETEAVQPVGDTPLPRTVDFTEMQTMGAIAVDEYRALSADEYTIEKAADPSAYEYLTNWQPKEEEPAEPGEEESAAVPSAKQQVRGLVAYDIQLAQGTAAAKKYGVAVPVGVDMLADYRDSDKILTVDSVSYQLFHLRTDENGETAAEPISAEDVTVEDSDGEINSFFFKVDSFSTFVLTYAVEFTCIDTIGKLQINLENLAGSVGESLRVVRENDQYVTVLNVAGMLAESSVPESEDDADAAPCKVTLLNGTAKEAFDSEFWANAAAESSADGVEVAEGSIRLTGDVELAAVAFTTEGAVLTVEIAHYTQPAVPVVPETTDGFAYRFEGETANAADILAANEIVSSYYKVLSVSDESLVVPGEDGVLTAQDYFDELLLTLSLSPYDDTEVQIRLTNPAPAEYTYRAKEENVLLSDVFAALKITAEIESIESSTEKIVISSTKADAASTEDGEKKETEKTETEETKTDETKTEETKTETAEAEVITLVISGDGDLLLTAKDGTKLVIHIIAPAPAVKGEVEATAAGAKAITIAFDEKAGLPATAVLTAQAVTDDNAAFAQYKDLALSLAQSTFEQAELKKAQAAPRLRGGLRMMKSAAPLMATQALTDDSGEAKGEADTAENAAVSAQGAVNSAITKTTTQTEVAGVFELTLQDTAFEEGDNELQPKEAVTVSLELDQTLPTDSTVYAIHFYTDEDGEPQQDAIPASAQSSTEGGTLVSFPADGFSVYAITYTVGLYSGGYTHHLMVGQSIALSKLFSLFNIVPSSAVESVSFSDPELMTVEALENDWLLTCLDHFDPSVSQTLTVTLLNGEVYTINVADAGITQQYVAADGETYEINVKFDADAQLPVDAVLSVEEIGPEHEKYQEYLAQALAALGVNAEPANEEAEEETTGEGEVTGEEEAEAQNQFARFFDITIMNGEEKVQPKASVTVSIKLADAPEDEELKVVHFDEENGLVVIQAEKKENDSEVEVAFEAESFSVYGVIVTPMEISPANELNGTVCTIRRANTNRYVTSALVYGNPNSGTPRKVGKTTDVSAAAKWNFEYAGQDGQYYISTTGQTDAQAGKKVYLYMEKISYEPDGSESVAVYPEGSGEWERPKMAFTVIKLNNGNYTISHTDNNGTYYLNEFENVGGNGFAAWYQNNEGSTLSFDFTTAPNEVKQQYILLTRFEGDYYVILNDGTLVKTNDPDNNGVFKIDDPMVWTYNDKANLYHHAKETGFDGNNLASDYFYRYFDPDVSAGYTDEDYDTTTGHLTGTATEYIIDTRPLQDQMKINYANNKISSKDNPSNYIGIVKDASGLRIAGLKNADQAAEIYFVEMTDTAALVNAQNLVNDSSHTVNHIDISIVGHAAFSVPLAYGTYYYKDKNGQVQTLVVNRENPLTIDVAQDVPIDRDDVKRANITAYTLGPNGEHITKDNVFYITGYSGNVENGASTNQTRIEGVFKVTDLNPIDTNDSSKWVTPTDAELPGWYCNSYHSNVPNQTERKERLKHIIYYTVSTTKRVTFDLAYNGMKLYDSYNAADTEAADGVAQGSATVTLGQTMNYWDFSNECPPIGWDRSYWENGGIIYGWDEKTGSGLDFQLGTVDKEKYGVLAIEITKYIVDKENNPITPMYDVNNVFHIYHSPTALPNDVISMDVDAYSGGQAGYNYTGNDYTHIHDKKVTVGEGGIGTVYDYDVDGGMIYIEEDASEANLPRSVLDVEGRTWTYQKTYLKTEYVWRDNGIENRYHVSKDYTSEEEAYRSIPDVLGNYKDVNGVDRYNGFLEFYVYNVYDAEPISVTVKKNWKHVNGSDAEPLENATMNVELGRYKLVEDETQQIKGDLVIYHTIAITEENTSGTYFATYKVKQGNKVFRSASYALDTEYLYHTLNFTGLPAGTYTLEITESTNGYEATTSPTTQTVVIVAGNTIESGEPATVSVSTSLKKHAPPKLVTVNVNVYQGDNNGVNVNHNSPTQNLQYRFLAGKNIVFTIYRPAGAYEAQNQFWAAYSDFTGSIYTNLPWPDVGENSGSWIYTAQDWKYPTALPEDGGQVTINFVNNWGAEKFYITAVALENEESQEGGSGNEGGSGGEEPSGSNNLPMSVQSAPAALTSISPTGTGPASDVPGMKYVDDEEWSYEVFLGNGLWHETVMDLEPVDEHGQKYLYYIRSVDENGLAEGTTAQILDDGSGHVLTSDGDTALEVTNTIPDEKPKLTIKKVDNNGYPLPDATFQISNGTKTWSFTINASNGVYTTEELDDGIYTVTESAPPSGYQAISNFQFKVENSAIAPSGTLPDGVTFDDGSYSFTVPNTPVNSGNLKILKRWLDFYGNAGAAGDHADIKLIQLVQDQQPQHIVRVEFYYLGADNGQPREDQNDPYTKAKNEVKIGRGTATVTFHWDQYTHIPIDNITVIGPGTVSSTGNTDEFILTIPDTGNGNDTVIVRINNNNYDPFNDGDVGSIGGITFPNANTPAESYSVTGGTRTVRLDSSNNWAQEFTYNGDGILNGNTNSTVLPATYDNRECRYMIVEEPVPDGYSVFYSDNNVQSLGMHDSGIITAYNRKNTADVELVKVDQKNRTTRLPDAEFTLYKLDTNQVGGVRLDGWSESKTTSAQGTETFTALPYGYYELEETKAPAGYTTGTEKSMFFKLTTEGLTRLKKDETKNPTKWSSLGNDSLMAINGGTLVVGNIPAGALKIRKNVLINGAAAGNQADGDYFFRIQGPAPSNSVTKYLRINISGGEECFYELCDDIGSWHYDADRNDWYWDNDGTWRLGDSEGYTPDAEFGIVPDLPEGDYTVTEIMWENVQYNQGGFVIHTGITGNVQGVNNSDRSATVTVTAGNTASIPTAAFTNDLIGERSIKARKQWKENESAQPSQAPWILPNGRTASSIKVEVYRVPGAVVSGETGSSYDKTIRRITFVDSAGAPVDMTIEHAGKRVWVEPVASGGLTYRVLKTVPDNGSSWSIQLNGLEKIDWVNTLIKQEETNDPDQILNFGYQIKEVSVTDDQGGVFTGYSVAYSDDNQSLWHAEDPVTITNTQVTDASLILKKALEVSVGSPVNSDLTLTDGTYSFTVVGPKEKSANEQITKEVSITATTTEGTTTYIYKVNDVPASEESGGGVKLTGLTPGTYTIKETGWTMTPPAGSAMFLDEIDCPESAEKGTNLEKRTIDVLVGTGEQETVAVTYKNLLQANTVTHRKMVLDTNDSDETAPFRSDAEHTWEDSADYDIGDLVPYRVTGFLPQAFYKSMVAYYYEIQDTMQNLQYESGTGHMFAFVKGPADEVGSWYQVDNYFTVSADDSLNFEHGSNWTGGGTVHYLQVKTNKNAGLKAIAGGYRVTSWGSSSTHDNVQNNEPVLGSFESINPNHIQYLQFRYKARLLNTANIGTVGNANDARIVYTKGDTTGNTDWDRNRVFTYKLKVTKTYESGRESGDGEAVFALYKKYKAAQSGFAKSCSYGTNATLYGTAGMVPSGNLAPDDSADGNYYLVNVTHTNGTDVYEWNGIDDGDYILLELSTARGYDVMPKPIHFTVNVEHDQVSDDPKINENSTHTSLTVRSENGVTNGCITNADGVSFLKSNNNDIPSINAAIPNYKTGGLNITKAVVPQDDQAADDTVFTFQVEFKKWNVAYHGLVKVKNAEVYAANGTTHLMALSANGDWVSTGSAGTLLLKVTGTGTAEITGIPDGVVCKVTEPEGQIPSGWVYKDTTPNDTVTIDASATTTPGIVVTNYRPGALQITKTVTVNGEEWTTASPADGAYTFAVKGPSPAETIVTYVQITVTNGQAASYKLSATDTEDAWAAIQPENSSIAVVSGLIPGTYTVTEAAPTNGTTLTGVTVNGTPVAAGTTAATLTVAPGSEATANVAGFTNNKPYITYSPQVTKMLAGDDENDSNWPSGGFEFTLAGIGDTTAVITAGTVTLPASVTVTARADSKLAAFGDIVFTAEGTYTFTITETVPAGAVGADGTVYSNQTSGWFVKDGIAYNAAPVSVTVTVEESDGVLSVASVQYGSADAATGQAILTAAGSITNTVPTSLKIVKVDVKNAATLLSGASFRLDKGTPVSTTDPETGAASQSISWTAYFSGVATYKNPRTTDSQGEITFTNLTDGQYRLVETQAPAGYVALTQEITFTVENGAVSYTQGSSSTVTYGNSTFTVPNTPGVELPATGGPGTVVYTVTGLTLTLGAALWLILRRRKEQQN